MGEYALNVVFKTNYPGRDGFPDSMTASCCGHTCTIKIIKPWWFTSVIKACLFIRYTMGIYIPRFVTQCLYDSIRYESGLS